MREPFWLVICLFVCLSDGQNPEGGNKHGLSSSSVTEKSREGAKKFFKNVSKFYFTQPWTQIWNHQTLRYRWNGENRCGSRQPEYISWSGVVRDEKQASEKRGRMEMPGTSPYKRFFGSVSFESEKREEEEERKLFIGLVPSVFLWNVIITQAGLIYCIYRQLPESQELYYLSIFSQLNIRRKRPRTATKAARLLPLNLLDQEGKGCGCGPAKRRHDEGVTRRATEEDWRLICSRGRRWFTSKVSFSRLAELHTEAFFFLNQILDFFSQSLCLKSEFWK